MTITSGRKSRIPFTLLSAGLITAASLVTPVYVNFNSDTFTRRAVPTKDATAVFNYWQPVIGDRLQIQFAGLPVTLDNDFDVYDLDLFDTEPELVRAIHKSGAHAICYINAGAWEEWRPDADKFPQDVIGNDYSGWPGEKWLDIRKLDELTPIIAVRLDLCKEKGFDGVEPDNLDGYQNNTGFDINASDQAVFNTWLAGQAHSRGLSIGLKNDPDQIDELVKEFDFAVTEDCLAEEWCDSALPFIRLNKPVFAVEYTDRIPSLSPYCSLAHELGIEPILKHRELDAYRSTCD